MKENKQSTGTEEVIEKKKPYVKAEATYTLEDARKEIQVKAEAQQADEQKRLREFVNMVKIAQAKTGCSFKIDASSPLNNLQIIPVPTRN